MEIIKLTRENWEDEFNNKLVDWNSPRFIQSNYPVRDVKEFIKQLLEDIVEKQKDKDKQIMTIDFRKVKEILAFEDRNEETINFVYNVLKDAEVNIEE